MEIQDLELQLEVEKAITREATALAEGEGAWQQAKALSGLAILLPQLTSPGVPAALATQVTVITALVSSDDASLKVSAVLDRMRMGKSHGILAWESCPRQTLRRNPALFSLLLFNNQCHVSEGIKWLDTDRTVR